MTSKQIMAIGTFIFLCNNLALLLVFGWPAMILAMAGESGMVVFMVGAENG